ncbi:BatD family protein [Chryseobacterium sp. MP_3.2]|uniref:BatD family protein n=1 Tax=Chryseobacterium sp. MP_3.2 TaxID=3071712 RepID=UPI002E09E832|nr:hypothetical protein [Chryseobacterium sp. MP_3.2]
MKRKIPYLFLLFSALIVSGQVTLAISEVREAKVNQNFELTVLLEISGENMAQETPLRMPDLSKFNIIGSASDQNTLVVDAKKGNVLNQTVFQLVLAPRQSGRVKFGSVLVTVNGKIYKTEPFDLFVRESEKSSVASVKTDNSVHLNLEIQDKVVYKNEPTLAVLRATSRDYGNLRNLKNIRYPDQNNLNIKQVSSSKSEIETRSGMASQIVGTFVIYPTESGTIEVNPASASLANTRNSKRISSNKVNLKVKKLPAGMPINYKNAVGKFEVALISTNSGDALEMEKPISVTVQISGAGNFSTLHLPKIVESENYNFYPPKITSVTNAGSDGLYGSITADYLIVPKKIGTIPIMLEDFSFFDPGTNQYVDLGRKTLLLNVKSKDDILASRSTLEKVNEYTNTVLETVNTPILPTENLKLKSKDQINWQAIAGNLGLLAVLLSLTLLVRKKVKEKPAKVKPTPQYQTIGAITETEETIRKNWNNRWEDDVEYLKIVADSKDFTKFFTTYEDLNRQTKEHFSVAAESDFKKFLENEKGAYIADEYRKLTEQIQIEKYAPLQSEEHIDELLQSIITIYSAINK